MRLLILLLLFPFSLISQKLTYKEWKEDLFFMHQKMEERHANLYHDIDKTTFTNEIKELAKKAGKVSEKELLIRISELISKVKDAHTYFHIDDQEKWTFKILPIKIDYFEDGLFVVGADKKHQSLIGSKIIAINNHPVEEVIKKVKLIGYNENEFTQLISVARFIVYPEILKRYGFAKNAEKVSLTFLNPQQRKINVSLHSVSKNEIVWIQFEDLNKDLPLTYIDNDSIYWSKYVPSKNMLYVQINSCTENANHQFTTLKKDILNYTQAKKPKKLVLDLRRNIGGNSQLIYPLLYALMHYEQNVPEGQIFVIISRWTLSASIVFSDELNKFCKPIFIGEPTGSAPNLYGENSYFLTLPNSKIKISYASAYFQAAGPFVNKPWIAPDIYIPIQSDDYFNMKQPILKYIEDYVSPEKSLTAILESLIKRGKADEAVEYYHNYKSDIKNKYVNTQTDIRRMANRLSDKNVEKYGLQFHQLNIKAYPNNVLVLVNLAEFLDEMGKKEEAKIIYMRTLKNLKTDKETNAYLKHYIEDYVNDKLTVTQ